MVGRKREAELAGGRNDLGSKQTTTIPCRMQLWREDDLATQAPRRAPHCRGPVIELLQSIHEKKLARKARSVLLQYDATYLGESVALPTTINEGKEYWQ